MTEIPSGRSEDTARLFRAVLLRPELWWVAVRCLFRFAPRGWWHGWPPVPRPARDYWRFRVETAYGGDGSQGPTADDLIEFLRWCRARHA